MTKEQQDAQNEHRKKEAEVARENANKIKAPLDTDKKV